MYVCVCVRAPQMVHGVLVFRGPRVRVGLHSGILSEREILQGHQSGRVKYSGPIAMITKAVSDAGAPRRAAPHCPHRTALRSLTLIMHACATQAAGRSGLLLAAALCARLHPRSSLAAPSLCPGAPC